MKSNEEIGREAASIARNKILKEAQNVGLTTKKVLQRISEGLDAFENKVFYDKDRGKCIVGPDQIAHDVRLDAAKVGISIWGMKAPEKVDVNLPDQIQYTPEERKIFKELAIKQAKEELKKLHGKHRS